MIAFEVRRSVYLFPSPIGLGVASCKSQLAGLGSIRQHHPDLFLARAARLKHNMPPIRRPRRKIVAPAIMCQLHPLLAGDVHQVNVGSAGLTGTIFANPCHRQELSIRRPSWRNRVALVRDALLVRAVGLHGVNLRQSGLPADEGDLRSRLPVPYRRNVRTLVAG